MSNIEIEDIKDIENGTKKENFKFKILLVGDSGVGKTCLFNRFTDGSFNETKATVGAGFTFKTYEVKNDIIIFEIWDTAGQERYKSVTSGYYKGSKGVLIVYDITKLDTFEKIEQWLSEVKEKAGNEIKVVLVGNKLDLEDRREVSLDQSAEKASILNCPLMETSALDNTNVEKAFKELLIEIYKDIKKSPELEGGDKKLSGGKSLETEKKSKKDKKCCD